MGNFRVQAQRVWVNSYCSVLSVYSCGGLYTTFIISFQVGTLADLFISGIDLLFSIKDVLIRFFDVSLCFHVYSFY